MKKYLNVLIRELHPNPFKAQINEGKLDEEQVQRLMSSMKELDMMGAFIAFKKDDKYYLVNGHHRLEAYRRLKGDGHRVFVEVHDYKEDQVLRGMVVENFTQRTNDIQEEIENIILIYNYLQIQKDLKEDFSARGAKKSEYKGIGRPQSEVTAKDVSEWLNKHGKIMSERKIYELFSLHRGLAPSVMEHVKNKNLSDDPDTVPIKTALKLATIEDKKEQERLANALIKDESLTSDGQRTMIDIYKESSDQDKEDILTGRLQLADITKVDSPVLSQFEMQLEYMERSADLSIRVRRFGDGIRSFRTQRLYETFSPAQRTALLDRLMSLKREYTNCISEIDENIGVLK